MNKQRIPKSDSIRELAHFWDTHDLTDFEDELEQVHEPVFERESVLKVHLQADEAEAVMELARSKGVSYNELVRKWVLERIRAG